MTRALPHSALFSRHERLWPLVLASLIVHAALLTVAILYRPAPRIDLGQKPIVAKLVRLGEKRPPQFLPRKEQAAPAPAPAAPSAPTATAASARTPRAPALQAKPAPKPAPAPAAATGRGDVLASVLSRVQRDKALSEPVYGDPTGDPRGDASDAGEGDRYLALVQQALRDSYVLPSTISERDRLHLKATVILYLDADGTVLRHAFESRSGDGSFDAALERAIRAARIPPPPAELRNRYRTEGLGVVYRP